MIGGRLYRGWAELGHIVIVEDGEPCRGACSGRGHVESYCSGRAGDALAQGVLGPDATARDLVEQRASGARGDRPPPRRRDRLVRQHLPPAGRRRSEAASASPRFELLLPSARLAVLRRGARTGRQELALEPAELGSRAGMIGAGLVALDALSVMPLAVCATPIGNLEDVTLRVLAELRDADLVLAEDTRHTRGLLERHGISARLLSYHEHNEAARVAELLPRLEAGERMALVSDAGHAGRSPTRARGSSAAALDAGVDGDRAARAFRGRDGARRERPRGRSDTLRRLPAARGGRARSALGRARGLARPVVAFESPQRLGARFARSPAFAPERQVAVCRELTKRFEEVVRGTAGRARGAVRDAAEGRDHARARAGASARSDAAAAATPSPSSSPRARRRRVAAEVVSRLTGTARNELYRASL